MDGCTLLLHGRVINGARLMWGCTPCFDLDTDCIWNRTTRARTGTANKWQPGTCRHSSRVRGWSCHWTRLEPVRPRNIGKIFLEAFPCWLSGAKLRSTQPATQRPPNFPGQTDSNLDPCINKPLDMGTWLRPRIRRDLLIMPTDTSLRTTGLLTNA
jgi:hypothetical protein